MTDDTTLQGTPVQAVPEQRDLARIMQAREIIGPSAELYVDANGGYTRRQAARVGAELTRSGVSWFEEPVSSDDVAGLAALREELEPNVTAAEHRLEDSGHCAPNLHARVAAAIPNVRHVEYVHDHQRIERMLFGGALSPAGGVMTPDSGRPGLGLELRTADAAKFLVSG
jgi:L-alanine-DL-glutamate epimerase-like enolase superfamily enzyme